MDAFSEMRDEKSAAEEDLQNLCFVCSKGRFDFDHYGNGFDNHRESEHDPWAYVAFFIYLDRKDEGDYTGTESFVREQMNRNICDFMPVTRAIALERAPREESDVLLENAAADSKTSLERIAAVNDRVTSLEAQVNAKLDKLPQQIVELLLQQGGGGPLARTSSSSIASPTVPRPLNLSNLPRTGE